MYILHLALKTIPESDCGSFLYIRLRDKAYQNTYHATYVLLALHERVIVSPALDEMWTEN